MKKLITIVAGCFNEEGNVQELFDQVRAVFEADGRYRFEIIFIDNASSDQTVSVLKGLAAREKNVKVIVNVRNFGHVRSPFHAFLQARGDAVVAMASDLQDPPSLLPQFLAKWEEGYKVVMGVNATSDERWPMRSVRRWYYNLLGSVSEVEQIKGSTGFGLYDQEVVEIIRNLDEQYPYFRGLLPELGFPIAQVPYHRPLRKRGITKNNFYTLFDMAMLGITSHSKVPLRLATIGGFGLSVLSFLIAILYLFAKLFFWYRYPAGVAPILIGLFATFSVQLFFLGLIGEYIGALYTRSVRRPLVIERERINFEERAGSAAPGERAPAERAPVGERLPGS